MKDHASENAPRYVPAVFWGLLAVLALGGLARVGLAQGPSLNPYAGSPMGAAPGGPNFEPIAPPLAAPQNGSGPVLVADVRIVGNRGIAESKIYAQIRTRRDREFDPDLLEGDVRRLNSTSLFSEVRTSTEMTPAGMIVTFQVSERPTIRYIKYVGNHGPYDKTLAKKAGLKVGDSLNMYAVEEARAKLEEFYRSKGYSKVMITLLEGDDPKDQGVVFLIHEGNLERIGKVEFVGNTIDTADRLKTQIESKPGFLYYFFKGRVDRQKIDQDVEKLTAYYRSLGFFRARIGRELEYDESGNWLTLRFVIDEGPRYVVRNVTIAGNEKFSTEHIDKELRLKPGEYFNLGKMNRDVNSIRDLYGAQGHIYADVAADPVFHEEPGELDLIYKVQEGDVYRVGKINVHIDGEFPHTRQDVILNRLSLRPGQIIDMREVRNSERRLKSSQLFKSDPQTGEEPKIIIPPPELDEALARRPGGATANRPAIRGQSPEGPAQRPHVVRSEPKDIDLNVYVQRADQSAAPAVPAAATLQPPPAPRYSQPVLRMPSGQWQPEHGTWQP